MSCSGNTRLHFVYHQQDIFFFAKCCRCCYKLFFKRHHTAFALDQFNKQCANIVCQLCFQIVNIVCFGIVKPFRKRKEEVVEHILSCSGKRSHGPAVERIYKRYDFLSAAAVFIKAVFSCDLNRALVCFCARITQEHFFHTRQFAQFFCHIRLQRRVIQVRNMLQSSRLFRHRLCPSLIAVSQAIHADTAGKVNILSALCILCDSTLTADKRRIKPSVSVHHIPLLITFDLFKFHLTLTPLSLGALPQTLCLGALPQTPPGLLALDLGRGSSPCTRNYFSGF